MSGHSKWSTIKRAKGVNDVKRGQLFTKLAREIVIASREGGADAEAGADAGETEVEDEVDVNVDVEA